MLVCTIINTILSFEKIYNSIRLKEYIVLIIIIIIKILVRWNFFLHSVIGHLYFFSVFPIPVLQSLFWWAFRLLIVLMELCMYSVQISCSICLTLCNTMNHSMPGLPVHHQLPEFTQTYVHWVGDAIQPSHPLSSPSPPALNLSQHQGLFKWASSSHQVAKVLEFQLQHQSFQWIFRTDFL